MNYFKKFSKKKLFYIFYESYINLKKKKNSLLKFSLKIHINKMFCTKYKKYVVLELFAIK